MIPTSFSKVYDSFLSKITDDMYLELTEEDTKGLLRELLLSAIPKFQFPRIPLDYEFVHENLCSTCTNFESCWQASQEDQGWIFIYPLEREEINILATYMIVEWLGQQLASIENVRMKYSGADFKFTSQANHMQKILQMKKDYEREGFHLQRLYKRRIRDEFGVYRSTMPTIMDLAPDYKIGGRHTNDCDCQFYDDAIHWHGLDQVDKEAAEDQDHDCHCGG